MDTLRDTEHTIFDLRKKADLFLQAGNTEEFNRIQTTIGHLQELYGAVTGVEREDNERTA
jgi:hypothetical protein